MCLNTLCSEKELEVKVWVLLCRTPVYHSCCEATHIKHEFHESLSTECKWEHWTPRNPSVSIGWEKRKRIRSLVILAPSVR
jgi:hypothetical protein